MVLHMQNLAKLARLLLVQKRLVANIIYILSLFYNKGKLIS
jgi:hypothetical protein